MMMMINRSIRCEFEEVTVPLPILLKAQPELQLDWKQDMGKIVSIRQEDVQTDGQPRGLVYKEGLKALRLFRLKKQKNCSSDIGAHEGWGEREGPSKYVHKTSLNMKVGTHTFFTNIIIHIQKQNSLYSRTFFRHIYFLMYF